MWKGGGRRSRDTVGDRSFRDKDRDKAGTRIKTKARS